MKNKQKLHMLDDKRDANLIGKKDKGHATKRYLRTKMQGKDVGKDLRHGMSSTELPLLIPLIQTHSRYMLVRSV